MSIINTAMPDVKAGIKFVQNAKIVKTNQLLSFLKAKKIKKERCEKIMDIMVKNRFVYQKENSEYITSSPVTTYMDFSETKNKSIWFYINHCINSDYVNYECKFPCALYASKFETKDIKYDDLTVFYIKYGDECLMSRVIETVFGGGNGRFKVALILDDIQQLQNVFLSEIFEIILVTTVTTDGVINNYTNGGEKIEDKK